ncbi:MAG TPA: hypothetical protein VFP80_10430 [Thermoanaerobaculia bacterium]|nr:hypothetical protein [Thermoanaerobaculia bacterium]
MAIVLAVLYFALVELVLLDSQRELGEARRFRARIVAETLAENAAELAALQIVARDSTPQFSVNAEDGTMSGRMVKSATGFEIHGEGTTSGITESTARVILRGRVVGTDVRIQYSLHP